MYLIAAGSAVFERSLFLVGVGGSSKRAIAIRENKTQIGNTE
ncbi:hypothetical protein [Nostoc commune]|nr:hypothetical protein [Nostoc commune]